MKLTTPIICSLLILMTLIGCATESSDSEYKIGAILPLSGPGSNLGEPMAQGMLLAIEEINDQGGINGNELRLVVQDGKLEGKASVAAAQYLLDIENPDIFSILFHLPAQAVGPILENSQKPFVYEAFTRSLLDNQFAFKANFDALSGCEKLIKYAKQNNHYNKLGVVMAKTEYNELCVQGIKKVEPNIKEYWYVFGETDFRSLLTKADADDIDAIMTVALDFEYINMFKQITELDLSMKMFCATSSECIIPKVKDVASPDVLEGTLSIDFISPDIVNSEFAAKYEEQTKKTDATAIAYAAVGYEQVMIISQAMKNCRPKDSICLRDSLSEVIDYHSLLNTDGFKQRVLQVETQIYEFKDGHWNNVKI